MLGDRIHRLVHSRLAALPGALTARVIFEALYVRRDPWAYRRDAEARRRRALIASVCDDEPASHVVELGCGEGFLTEALAAHPSVGAVTGMDVSSSALRRARRRLAGRASLVRADVRRSAIPRADLIVGADLFYYFTGAQMAAVVAAAVGALDAGGRLALSHPARWAPMLHAAPAACSALEPVDRRELPTFDDAHVVEIWRRVAD